MNTTQTTTHITSKWRMGRIKGSVPNRRQRRKEGTREVVNQQRVLCSYGTSSATEFAT
jgi:hypothetical protein